MICNVPPETKAPMKQPMEIRTLPDPVDKYRPTNLNKLHYHQEQAASLKRLVQSDDFPHLLIYGPSGAGKKTRMVCILCEFDAGIHDRVVIMGLLKEVAQSHSLDTSHKDFKVVVLTEVDRLTKDAQHALRHTMELYTGTCRLILVCNSTSKLIPAIKSRCLAVRVPAPTIDEICSVLQYVVIKNH
uniref:AAA+ ATPase domain-containing protein n=1 Tax=Amphimedon queenslandica TaxID=400682 RepID=A0A1X7TWA2_AMPQE